MRRAPLVAGAGAAAAWSAPALAAVWPPVAHALRIERRLPGRPQAVGLTFDDGPHREGTPAILECLARAGASATFFLVGEQVERDASLAAEIASAGHSIGVHAYRHRNLLRLTRRQLAADLDRAAEVIGSATGSPPRLHRPPYGIFSPLGLRMVRRRGWRPLLWSRWGRDWSAGATATSIADLLTRRLAAGDVLLLHDADHYSAPGSWRRTASALPRVLEAIESRGLRPIVP
ncbi:MAG: polysaccharide deacetylase family protein [Solirubrobacteraceae bacterium]